MHELHCGVMIGSIEFVGNIPAERAELAAFLHGGVQEADCVQKRLPLWQVVHIELVLGNAGKSARQSRLHTLRRLVRKLKKEILCLIVSVTFNSQVLSSI